MNYELERILEETFVALVKVVSQQSPGRTEESRTEI
jgi:hypothetical protein